MKPAKDNPFRAVRRAGVPICGIVMACSHCGQEYIVKNPPLGPYVCSKQVCKDAENKRLMETGEPNDIQRKFDETRATEAKRIAAGHIATPADRAKDPYLSADSIVYEGKAEAAKHTAAIEKAAPELYTYAKAEQLLSSCSAYAPDELAKAIGMPEEYRCIGDYLDKLRKDAIAKAEGREP